MITLDFIKWPTWTQVADYLLAKCSAPIEQKGLFEVLDEGVRRQTSTFGDNFCSAPTGTCLPRSATLSPLCGVLRCPVGWQSSRCSVYFGSSFCLLSWLPHVFLVTHIATYRFSSSTERM